MDLLNEIRDKLMTIKSDSSYESINAAIMHIEVAERHLRRGQSENDGSFFNDVIYRTNQTFEGMLKEAYTVLTGMDGSRLAPHQIEQQLTDQKILTPRVSDLFTHYRQNWRNPSTHDHKLLFNEQEAVLAIVNISAFTLILLDQIIEAVNQKNELEQIKKQNVPTIKEINDYNKLGFEKKVITFIVAFNNYAKSIYKNLKEMKEGEILGRFRGFLNNVDDSIKITREPIISQDIIIRPDLLLEKGDEKIVVEIKHYLKIDRVLTLALNEIQTYMVSDIIKCGILYFYPMNLEQEFTMIKIELKHVGKSKFLYLFMPKDENNMNIIRKTNYNYSEIDLKTLNINHIDSNG